MVVPVPAVPTTGAAIAVLAMAYVPNRVKPTAIAPRNPLARTASTTASAHRRGDAYRCDSPEAFSQKIPGSSRLGSTSGLKRRNRSASAATPRSTSAGGTSPACSVRASDNPAP